MTLPGGYIIYKYPTLPSTNEKAKELLEQLTIKNNFIVEAVEQSAGKTRKKDLWVSCPGNLFATLVLNENFSLLQLAELVILTAVSIGEAINLPEISYKWPNDIILGNKKLGGTLIEIIENKYIIIGVGVNTEVAPIKKAACLKPYREITASKLLEKWIETFDHYKIKWLEEGFSTIRIKWLQKCFNLNKQVKFVFKDKIIEGTLNGIDQHGSAILKNTKGEIFYFSAGDLFTECGIYS